MKLIHKDKTTFSKLLLGQPDKPDYQQDQNINININVLERLIAELLARAEWSTMGKKIW